MVKNLEDKTEDQVKQQVLDVFGKDYALRGVASVQQLGLDGFPLYATGKIVKSVFVQRIPVTSKILTHSLVLELR